MDTRSARSTAYRQAQANGCDVVFRSYLPDAAGRQSLVFDLSITHDRFGSSSHVQQNVLLYISFLPPIMSTSTRMHGEFLRLLCLQAHREIEAHFTAAGMSSQRNQTDSFRFKRAAFYQSLKSKVGLAAAKVAALRIDTDMPNFQANLFWNSEI